MEAEDVELEVGDEKIQGRVNVPADATGRGVVCLPGAGHGPYGGVFDRTAEAAAESGLHFLRYESWPEREDIGRKSLRRLHAEIDAAVERLESRGCTEVALLGKSFGGGIALTYAPGAIDRLALWAPAIRVGDESNVDAVYSTPLGNVDGVRVGPDTFEAIDVPVRILQGDEDEVMPLEESEAIVAGIPDGDLVVLDGRDHSFSGEAFERTVVNRTLDFLTA